MQLKHVVLDKLEEALLDLEGRKLVETEEAREEESDRRVTTVDLLTWTTLDTFGTTLVTHLDELDFTFEHFLVNLQRELMDDINVGVQTLSYKKERQN